MKFFSFSHNQPCTMWHVAVKYEMHLHQNRTLCKQTVISACYWLLFCHSFFYSCTDCKMLCFVSFYRAIQTQFYILHVIVMYRNPIITDTQQLEQSMCNMRRAMSVSFTRSVLVPSSTLTVSFSLHISSCTIS